MMTGLRSRPGAVTALCLLSACSRQNPPEAPVPGKSPAWDYSITVRADLSVDVEATFRGRYETGFVLDEDMPPFVKDVSVLDGASPRPTTRNGSRLSVICVAGCRLQYSVSLQEAAARLGDVDTALAAGGALFFPVSSLLVTPEEAPAHARYRVTVHTPASVRFATGLRPVKGTPGAYEADVATVHESTFAALGSLRILPIGDGRVVAAVATGVGVPDTTITRWFGMELAALDAYLGHFPEDRVLLLVAPGTSAVMRGVTRGAGGASILVRVPVNATSVDLSSEWVVAHELLHAGFPDIEGGHRWFSEGLASYVEPFARVRVGLTTPGRVWKDLMDGLPQGLPAPGDRGLEHDNSWGRTYWGGALYFLLVDVGIREVTHGQRSLQDGLRAIARADGTVETAWTIERIVGAIDASTGTQVASAEFQRLARAPGTVDLDALWNRLGIRRAEDGVEFDDGAELTEIRKAMTPVWVPTPAGGKLP